MSKGSAGYEVPFDKLRSDHCSMAAIPTLEEEDAKRPSRERESLVGERTRISNRIKATLARLGIRGFKPTLRKAAERLPFDKLRRTAHSRRGAVAAQHAGRAAPRVKPVG